MNSAFAVVVDKLDVYVEKHTQINGGVLNSDTGNLTLDTATFGFKDIQDHDKGTSISGQVGVTTPGAPGKLPGVSVQGSYASHDIEQVTKATVGAGTIVVRDTDKQKQDVKDINRDVAQAQVITKVERAGVELYGSSNALDEIASGFEGIQKNLSDIPNLPANLEKGIKQVLSEGGFINKSLGQAVDAIIDALKTKGELSPEEAGKQKEIQDKLKDPAYLKILEGCASGAVRCEYTQAQAATGLAVYEGAGLGAGALAAAPAALLGLALNTLFVSSSGGVLDKSATLSNGTVLSVTGGGSSGIVTLSAENPDGSQTILVLQSTSEGYVLQGGEVQAGGETWEMTQRQLTAVLDAASPALAQSGVVVVANNSNPDQKYYPKPKTEEITGFPGLKEVRGVGGRPRWIDDKGRIFEWDRQHGTLEAYGKTGKKHLGDLV
jgi:filamentous hemagglutinin